ncbi:uncharacterized protein NEMAJ01_0601 [Nematocida major]|uniref:uncharacterized protein n=1 Tax=Nematocida major TaxID=1912982 RepID=UPI002007F121|nr:uncharacterized protein NEMAJ01_0601 [Nematocida major]KAH9385705.1 hypothetical protein NEMAJ01_0601 [Nematocida major]
MKDISYWILLSVFEELRGNKRDIYRFGACLGVKIAEEISYQEISQDTLMHTLQSLTPTLEEYLQCCLQCAEENGEVRMHVKETSMLERAAEKVEIVAGAVSAAVERLRGKKVRVKTYAAKSLIVLSDK